MIIRIDSSTTDGATAARQDLDDLARDWGHELTESSAGTAAGQDAVSSADKVIDLVAVVSLVLSLPSAALAVTDIADRIQKRRRANKLIDHAQQLADHRTTLTLLTPDGHLELTHLDPDQVLDLFTTDDPSTSSET
jgi:hypothetical protein